MTAKFPADFPSLGDAVFVLLLALYAITEQIEDADVGIPSYGIGNPPVGTIKIGDHSYTLTIRDDNRNYIGDER